MKPHILELVLSLTLAMALALLLHALALNLELMVRMGHYYGPFLLSIMLGASVSLRPIAKRLLVSAEGDGVREGQARILQEIALLKEGLRAMEVALQEVGNKIEEVMGEIRKGDRDRHEGEGERKEDKSGSERGGGDKDEDSMRSNEREAAQGGSSEEGEEKGGDIGKADLTNAKPSSRMDVPSLLTELEELKGILMRFKEGLTSKE